MAPLMIYFSLEFDRFSDPGVVNYCLLLLRVGFLLFCPDFRWGTMCSF